jgi:hypothetical protein
MLPGKRWASDQVSEFGTTYYRSGNVEKISSNELGIQVGMSGPQKRVAKRSAI